MQSIAKPQALIRDLQDKLNVRLANNSGLNSSRQFFDSNNWPCLILSHNGNEAEGQPVLFIRISNPDMISKDVFGNQTYAYAPSILELAYELSSGGAPLPSRANIIVCDDESIKTGCRFQVKELANGTAVSAAAVTAAAPIADLDELYWPTKSV